MDESGVQMSEEVLGSTRPALNGRFVTGAEAQLGNCEVSIELGDVGVAEKLVGLRHVR